MSDELPQATVKGCLAEMDYRDVEGQFGQTFATSIPCQLRFTGETDQDTERFHDALDDRGYGSVDANPDRRQTSLPHYEGDVMSKEHYARIEVLVFRGGVVRLFPKDEYVPTEDELADLLEAIVIGFDSELEHDPIEREDDNAE